LALLGENTVDNAAELLPKTKHCYVCGPENPAGLHISFRPDGENGSRATYTAQVEHAGWPGILHGGLTFTLMDEALGWALYFHGLTGVTARIETRFRQPIPIGTKLVIRAWTVEKRRRTITARAEVRGDGGEDPLLAEADATMYLVNPGNDQDDGAR
jgi:acyl-coenzyme A thioesterase PaaI-like protein